MRGHKGGLAGLKQLHQQAQDARKEVERAERVAARDRARLDQAAPEQEVDAFRKAMQSARPIKPRNQIEHRLAALPDSPAAAARRMHATGEKPGRADAGISDGGVAHLLSENGTAYVRADAAPDTARKLKQGHWRAGAELDLHGLRVEQARHAVISFLDECLGQGVRCVRIVHGKGYGSEGMTPVLKDKARAWLAQKTEVLAFSEATPREGGSGALLVLMQS
ncbi:Smr/MutS family protein [Bordetella sp. FB-8]|uniref:Smr/MutS family protein n=1 Tax=Bordetella sp. FB-8 TaxID=1159870 RepID=UPI0003603991|nr:Smr/MutS family protein [Bordetella sp. FB-8]